MARLKIAASANLKQLGYALMEASVKYFENGKKPDPVAETQVSDLLDLTDGKTKLEFHYDSDLDNGDRIVHIIVPDLEGKRVVRENVVDWDDFQIEDIAAECMGSIVIRGCGQ